MENKHKKNKFFTSKSFWSWPVKVFFLTIIISLVFGLFSEAILSGSGLIVAILVLIFLFIIGVIADIIGVATAACDFEPINAMASKKINGAKQATYLIKNADKVSSICCDIIGDICGILSGAAGVIVWMYLFANTTGFLNIFTSSLVSAIIAGIVVFLKALGKNIALKYPDKVVLSVGRFMNFFTIKKNNKTKNK